MICEKVLRTLEDENNKNHHFSPKNGEPGSSDSNNHHNTVENKPGHEDEGNQRDHNEQDNENNINSPNP